MFDDFDLTIQCEEYYSDSDFVAIKHESYEDLDWFDANIVDVTVDDIPLNGEYLEYLLSTIDFK